ncbi:MAG: choice-of-anchor Q domain-containing protein [Acidobacteriota bacterium]
MTNLLRLLNSNKRVAVFLLVIAVVSGVFGFVSRSKAEINSRTSSSTRANKLTNNLAAPVATYTWNGLLSTNWQVPANWTPVRTPATGDVLVFDGSTPIVTNVPTEEIAELDLINNVSLTLQAETTLPPGSKTLTISGGAGSDRLNVPAGSSLTISGTTALTISLGSGSTAKIDGVVNLLKAASKLLASDAGAIKFKTGSTFAAGSTTVGSTGFTGNPFGTGPNGSVVFETGSASYFNEGDDPFGGSGQSVTTFNLGSSQSIFASSAFSSDGRSYGNLTLDGSQSYSGSGTDLLTILNTLTIASGSTLTLSGSAGGDLNLLGDINIQGTLAQNGRTVKFQGGGILGGDIQNVTNGGTFDNLSISKTIGSVKLGNTTTINGALQFDGTSSAVDVLDLNQNILNLNGTVGGTSSSTDNGFKGDLTGATLNIGGTGILGTVSFVSGARTLKSMTVNRTSSGSVTLGTDLTIGSASVGSLTLTNGVVNVGSNTLSLADFPSISRTNGYVIGNLKKTFGGTGAFTFTVGTANGYSPVDANITVGTGNSLTVKAVEGRQPNIILLLNALLRYWSISNLGSVTANLTFHYSSSSPNDIVGTEANYKIFKYNGGFTQFTPDAVGVNSPQDHFATLNSVSSFSDWTLAEKANQTITVNTPAPATAAYGASFTVAATASSGLPVAYSSSGVCTNVGDTFTMTSSTGTCTVKYDQAGDGNYNAAPQVTESVTAEKANQTITVNTPAPATAANGSSFTVAATASSGLPVAYSSSGVCTNVGDTFTMTSSTGTCTVKYDQGGDSNYNPAPQLTESVTAGKANQTITVDTHAPATAANGSSFTVAATASSGLPVAYSSSGVCTNVGDTFTMTSGTGTCTVKYDQVGDANYNAAPQVTESVTACSASVVVVTNTDDSGAGSLRDAIGAACPGSTITFNIPTSDPGFSGGVYTITLTSGGVPINKNLTIQNDLGPGVITVQRSLAASEFRIFEIAHGRTVNITGLTISNGSVSGFIGGGAIYNDRGTVTLTSCVFSQNSAEKTGGAIYNSGVFGTGILIVTNSTFIQNAVTSTGSVAQGGAIYSHGQGGAGNVTVTNSTFDQNSAQEGGGIFSVAFGASGTASLTVVNSTFRQNSGTVSGGGILNAGDLSGIATAKVINSTFSENSAPPSASMVGGGAIYNFINGGSATLEIGNTILRKGAASGSNILNNATFTSLGHNLSDDAVNGDAGTGPGGDLNMPGDQRNTDPKLGALASNGGPTQTHLLLPGSPAINAGDNALVTNPPFVGPPFTDQRGTGFPRIINSTVDIGAVEVNYGISATAGTPQSTLVNTAFATSLQATVTESGNPVSGISVTFTAPGSGASGTFPGNSTTANATTNGSGVATAPVFTANGVAGGPYNVVASLGAGLPTATFALTNTSSSSLRIDTVSPPAGRTSGGQQIILTGAFAALSTVTMGGTSATWVYTNGGGDTSSITVTTPAHAVGAVQIDLTPTAGSPYSKANAFAYLPTVFTDDTITVGVTTAKAQHIIELRQAVDAMRAVAGLSPAPWTDATLNPGSSIIKAIHIQELRTYLDDAATQLGYSTSPYTDPALTTGYVIKRIHIEELRQRIRVIAG